MSWFFPGHLPGLSVCPDCLSCKLFIFPLFIYLCACFFVFFGCLFNNCLSFGVSACAFFLSLFYISESIWISISIDYMPFRVINYLASFFITNIVILSPIFLPILKHIYIFRNIDLGEKKKLLSIVTFISHCKGHEYGNVIMNVFPCILLTFLFLNTANIKSYLMLHYAFAKVIYSGLLSISQWKQNIFK